jgi:Zn-dependent oligopeptidase
MRDFWLAALELPAREKARLKAVDEELLNSARFDDNVPDATSHWALRRRP